MQGAVGLKRILALSACTAGLFTCLLAAAPSANAAWSLTGSVFAEFDSGGTYGDLYRTKPDGTWAGTWARLTYGNLDSIYGLSADPRGRFVVVGARANPDAPYRLYRVSAKIGPNGSEIQDLIGNNRGFDPAVSPDGDQVAYIHTGSSGPSTINVVNSKGGKPRTIYNFCSGCISKPVWAGKRIFFNRRITRDPSADSEVFSVLAGNGKGLRQHTDDEGGIRDNRLIDVSPDGKHLLIAANDLAGPSPDVFLNVVTHKDVYERTVMSGFTADTIFGGSFGPGGPDGAVIWLEVNLLPYRMWVTRPGVGSSPALPEPAGSTSGPLFMDWVWKK